MTNPPDQLPGAGLRVLQVSAEIFPLLKTGGLADVAGALPAALIGAGADVRVLLPGFDAVMADLSDATALPEQHAPWGATVRVLRGRLRSLGLIAYLIDAPELYARTGGPYEDTQRRPYADNDRRFALLGWVAAALARGLDAHWAPRVLHGHDWHAGLAPAYMDLGAPQPQRVASVFTVHNLAYQGLFPARHFDELGLPASAYAIDGLEFYGQVSFMKAGLYYADAITTVSPTYAREITSPEQGCGLDGLLRARAADLHGMLNGIDPSVWNPATDAALATPFSVQQMAGKARCKADLQAALGLQIQAQAPLFGVVSRLTEQKGLHLVLATLDNLLAQGAQLVVLGSGEAALEQAFTDRARAYPSQVATHIGYNEALAHRIFGATDVTLVPSRFEPCGLTQMYGLAYGSLPLVHAVGGLADTVVDCSLENLADGSANGFVFRTFDAAGLARAQARALALYAQPARWRAVRRHAMTQRLDWADTAQRYFQLYRHLAPAVTA